MKKEKLITIKVEQKTFDLLKEYSINHGRQSISSIIRHAIDIFLLMKDKRGS